MFSSLQKCVYLGGPYSCGNLPRVCQQDQRVRLGPVPEPAEPTGRIHHQHDRPHHSQDRLLVPDPDGALGPPLLSHLAEGPAQDAGRCSDTVA